MNHLLELFDEFNRCSTFRLHVASTVSSLLNQQDNIQVGREADIVQLPSCEMFCPSPPPPPGLGWSNWSDGFLEIFRFAEVTWSSMTTWPLEKMRLELRSTGGSPQWEFGDSSRGHGKDINGSGVALKWFETKTFEYTETVEKRYVPENKTWQFSKSTIRRCISYRRWGYSPIALLVVVYCSVMKHFVGQGACLYLCSGLDRTSQSQLHDRP